MKILFAPGCALRVYKPELVDDLTKFLSENNIIDGTYDICCKSDWTIEEDVQIIDCCPGCSHQFSSRSNVHVISLWKVLLNTDFSPVFLNDCITFFGTIGKGIINLFREFVTGADSFGQLSNGISNSIVSGIVYWLIVAIVMGILFIITGFLIIGIGYQVGKIYRKYCWDIISIMVAIISTAIVIYFGEWIKSVIPINLIVLLLLVHVIYIGIRCYVKDWQEERGYY